MFADASLVFSGAISGNTTSGQPLAVSTTTNATNVIDLTSGAVTVQPREIGQGSDFDLVRIQITQGFTGGSAMTVNVVQADDAGITTNVTVVGSTGAIPVAQLTSGARFTAQINPRIGSRGQRYLSLQYIPNGTFTAGAVFADLGAEIQDGLKFYAPPFQVI